MTLPNVGLGNTATDISQGANSFATGLLAQRQRTQQLALQEALAKAKMGVDQSTAQHLDAQTNQLIPAQAAQANAQTGDLAAQEQQRQMLNQPADANDEKLFMHWAGPMQPGFFAGRTKGEVNDLIKAAAQAHAAGLRISLQENRNDNADEGRLRQNYISETSKIHPQLDNYRKTLNAFAQAKATGNPVAGEQFLLSWLRDNTNRMNQAEINRVAQLGGVENIAHRAISHIIGGVPMNPEMMKNFLDVATPGGIAHYKDYQSLRQNYSDIAQRHGLNPRNVVVDDDYAADIPQLERAIGLDINGAPVTTKPALVRPQGLP